MAKYIELSAEETIDISELVKQCIEDTKGKNEKESDE